MARGGAVDAAAAVGSAGVRDRRTIHPLQAVLAPEQLRAERKARAEGGAGDEERRWACGGARRSARERSAARGGASKGDGGAKGGSLDASGALSEAHARARAALAARDPGELERLESRGLALRRKYARRRANLDNAGVFAARTNAVRANAMLRVEMHRALNSAVIDSPESATSAGRGGGGSDGGAEGSDEGEDLGYASGESDTPDAIYRRTVRRHRSSSPGRRGFKGGGGGRGGGALVAQFTRLMNKVDRAEDFEKIRQVLRLEAALEEARQGGGEGEASSPRGGRGGGGGARSQSQAAHAIPRGVLEARNKEKAAAVRDKVGRYRRAVTQRRAEVLEAMGLSARAAEGSSARGGDGTNADEGAHTQAHSALYEEMADTFNNTRPASVESTRGGIPSGLNTNDLVAQALARAETAGAHVEETRAWEHARADEAREREEAKRHVRREHGAAGNPTEGVDLVRQRSGLGSDGAAANIAVAAAAATEAEAADEGDDERARLAAEELKRVATQARKEARAAEEKRRARKSTDSIKSIKSASSGQAEGSEAESGARENESDAENERPPGSAAEALLLAPGGVEGLRLVDPAADQLPPLDHAAFESTSAWLLARLERIFKVLDFSPMQQMDMVIKYTGREMGAGSALEAALELWEAAAGAISQREERLASLMALADALKADAAGHGSGSGVDLAALEKYEAMVAELDELTGRCLALSEQLTDLFGDILCLSGRPYDEKILDGDGLMAAEEGDEADADADAASAHLDEAKMQVAVDDLSRPGAVAAANEGREKWAELDDDEEPLTAEESARLEELLREAEAPV